MDSLGSIRSYFLPVVIGKEKEAAAVINAAAKIAIYGDTQKQ